MLKAYIVFDNVDKAKLTKIFERTIQNVYDRPRIISCNYSGRAIETNENFKNRRVIHPRYPTCYDAIESSNMMVMRTLVEWQSIHIILMMPDMETALNEIQDVVSGSYVVDIIVYKYAYRRIIQDFDTKLHIQWIRLW